MKNKGFTLIELLAVIAILAIILLIAVPKVLNVIASAKTNAAKSSAQMIWKTAENCIAMNIIDATHCNAPGTGTAPVGYGSAATTALPVLGNLGSFDGTYTVTVTGGNTVAAVTVVTGGTTCALNAYTDTSCAA